MSDTTTKRDAKSLLSSLTVKKAAAPAAVKSSRPDVDLDKAAEETLARYSGAKALLEVIEAREEQEKGMLAEAIFAVWTERLWKGKTRPANPSMKLAKNNKPDISAIFQVHERYAVNLPEVPENKTPEDVATELFVTLFTSNGMDKKEAEEAAKTLVQNELDFTPKTTVDLNKLMYGHYEGEGKNRSWVEASSQEKSIADKVLRLFSARSKNDLSEDDLITDAEASQIIDMKASISVKAGFLQRVFTYVKSLDQLKAVFSVLKPVRYPSHIKFAVSDSLEDKNKRLAEVARDILGVS